MNRISETALTASKAYGAFSASLAFSCAFAAMAVDEASAQQNQPQNGGTRNVELETINVEGEGGGEGGTGLDGNTLNPKAASSVKATAPLLNTPQTVTVIPRRMLDETNSTTLTEALRNTPGITFDAGENGFGAGTNEFNIRGFKSTGSIFVDGARDNGSFTRDTFNIERVEVIKGPAGDNGRGTAGGYINMVTKVPHLDNFYKGTVGGGFDEYDSDARFRGTADINQQIGDTAAIRLNVMGEAGGVPGRETIENNALGFAPSLALGLGTDFRAYLSYEHVTRDDIPDSGVAFNRAGQSVYIPGAGPNNVNAGGARDFFHGREDDFDDVNSDSLVARFEYDITDSITISNQTRWAEVDRDAAYVVPGTALVGASGAYGTRQGYERNNRTLSNLTNVKAEFDTGSFAHTLSTGIELTSEKSDGVKKAANTLNFAGTNSVDVQTAAIYVYDTIELNDQWQISAGLRAEHYEVDLTNLDAGGNPVGAHGYSNSENTLGGSVGVVYKPVKEGSIYAAYGLSHLPAGSLLSNPDISRPSDEGVFPGFVDGAKPVELHSFEAGVKWDFFDGDLTTTAALFRTEKHNAAYSGVGGPVYGEQIVQGVELGISGKVTEAWSVFGGLTLLDSERKHGADVDTAVSGDYGANGTYFPAVTTTNGDELSFTPNVTASLWTTYRWNNGFTLGGGVQYVGESWIGRPDDATRIIPNGKFGKLPDYFLVNVMAEYEINENIKVRVNVDNIFDEEYLKTANWNGNWGYLGAPRTFWLSSSFEF